MSFLNPVERLEIRRGEVPSDVHVRALEAAISRQTPLRGTRGVRHRVFPWGTITKYSGGNGGYVSTVFLPSVSRVAAGFEVTWLRGLIAGVEPTVEDIPISGSSDGATPPPKFAVNTDTFNAEGEALIYFELQLSEDWIIQRIVPVSAVEPLPDSPFRARKLALVLRDDGSIWRALYTNQGWIAVNRRAATGMAQHLFWGKF